MAPREPSKLPAPDQVMRLLADLIGRRIVVKKIGRIAPAEVAGVASYVDGASNIRFAAVVDLPFLASSGAALAIIPVGQVADAIQSKKLPPAILDNSFEILNIASALMNELEGAVHVKITKLDLVPNVPPGVQALVSKPAVALDLEVEIQGYPKGKLSLLSTHPGKA